MKVSIFSIRHRFLDLYLYVLVFWRKLFPSRPSQTIYVFESIPAAPVPSKTDPCALSYEGLQFGATVTGSLHMYLYILICWGNLFPSRPSQPIYFFESTPAAPVPLKTDLCASSYEVVQCCAFVTGVLAKRLHFSAISNDIYLREHSSGTSTIENRALCVDL